MKNTLLLLKSGRRGKETQCNAMGGREEEEIKCMSKATDSLSLLKKTRGEADAELASLWLLVSNNWLALLFCHIWFAWLCRWSCRHADLNSWKEYNQNPFSFCSVWAVNQKELKLWLIPIIKLMKHVYTLCITTNEKYTTSKQQHVHPVFTNMVIRSSQEWFFYMFLYISHQNLWSLQPFKRLSVFSCNA